MYKLLILVYINYAAAALESRIVGGRYAAPGEVGYIVSLHKYYYHVCGGAIINEYNVITAAHCLNDYYIDHHKIIYGVLELVDPEDVVNIMTVDKEFVHESFDPSEYIPIHDIAIIRLSSSLPFDSSNVRPIPLPTQGQEFRTNSWARGAGWGSVDTSDDGISNYLKIMKVYFLPLERCKSSYGSRFREENQLCIGNKHDIRRGSCDGDSGSPLVKINKGKEKLAGVFSGVLTPDGICGKNEYPMLFTKVSHYVNWIKEQLLKI